MRKQLLISILLIWACLLAQLPARALSTDQDQPIEVEADQAELDDLNNVSVYRGNVVVTQGSIRMTGDVMTVHSDRENELDRLIVEGNPATYRQLPDDSQIYDQARAMRMEYHDDRSLIILIRDAWVKQDAATLVGERIEYNTKSSRVQAWSRPGDAAPDTGDATGEAGRVRMTLKKKSEPE